MVESKKKRGPSLTQQSEHKGKGGMQLQPLPEDVIYVTVARMTAIPLPVAVTRKAWVDCVEWPDTRKLSIECESLRAEELLYNAGKSYGKWSTALSRGKRIDFEMRRIPADGTSTAAEKVSLGMWLSRQGNGDNVLVIALATECR